jgi:D-glycero-D-manno-heptose 1,7-bisphosphate phosphatase
VRGAVFFDRDGVLNEPVVRDGKPYPPATVAELQISPGAKSALDGLRAAGFVLICVTNQPDVARGTLTFATLEALHEKLQESLSLDEVIACTHDDSDHCTCRKPQPGMILDAARRHTIDLNRSYLVGDRWRDIDAGHAAGCRTILVDRQYDERKATSPPHASVASIGEAARWILEDSAKP